MSQEISYSWRPLEDYRVPPQSLAKPELRELAKVWAEQRHELEQVEALQMFNERLRREWAIETGLIERVYTFDRGVTQILIERGIDASLIPQDQAGQSPERVAAMIRDHEAAIDGLFDFIRGDRALTTSYIKELHALLTRNQRTTSAVDSLGHVVENELLRGEYKYRPNSPMRQNGKIHEYCPPEQVASEMDRLLELHHSHQEVAPEVESAWLHHRFTQIHPFQDGNGRVARALATLVLIKAGWFPLVIRDLEAERLRYLDALEAADHGDLGSVVDVVAATQRKAFVQALGISGQVLRQTRVEHVIKAAREQLSRRSREQRDHWETAKEIATELLKAARDRFEAVAAELKAETSDLITESRFWADSELNGGLRDHYFRWQVIETAKSIGYYANTGAYRSWARLVIQAGSQAEILVSFHATGHEFRGIVGASACFFRREETEEGERQIVDLTPLAQDLFQVNYRESPDAATSRFQDWLEDVLVSGLEVWRTGL
ncbi:MAG: Fic family protein [bacterium]|nr:Fic family protein [bacterium]